MDNDTQQPQDFNNMAPVEAPQPGQQFKPDMPSRQPKKSKKKIILITVLILLLIAGGAAAAYFLYFKKEAPTTSTQESTQQAETKQPGPVSLLYSENSKVTQLKIADKSKIETLNLANSAYSTAPTVYKNKSAFIAAGEKEIVYYSEDNGKSYTKIYEAKAASSNNDLGEQITDIIFSTDGTSLLLGVLKQPGGANTLTQIPLDGVYSPNELMSVESSGAFFYAYDDDSQKVIMHESCYNCGGGYPYGIRYYETKTKQIGAIVKTDKPIISFSINDDLSQAIYVTGTEAENEGGVFATGPYTTYLVSNPGESTTTNTVALSTKGGDEALAVVTGFTNDNQIPYASYGTSLYTYKDSKEQEFYTPSKPIQDVYYIDDKQVISKNGEADSFTVNHFVLEGNQNTPLLDGTQTTYIIGTTYN